MSRCGLFTTSAIQTTLPIRLSAFTRCLSLNEQNTTRSLCYLLLPFFNEHSQEILYKFLFWNAIHFTLKSLRYKREAIDIEMIFATGSKVDDEIDEKDGIRDAIEDDPMRTQIIIEEWYGNRKYNDVGDKEHQHEQIPIEPSNARILVINVQSRSLYAS